MVVKFAKEHCCSWHCCHIYGQNSIINSVRGDDWTTELAITAGNVFFHDTKNYCTGKNMVRDSGRLSQYFISYVEKKEDNILQFVVERIH